MASLLERHHLLDNQEFLARLKMALADAAVAITTEAAGTPNHTERLAFAQRVLTSVDSYVSLVKVGVSALASTSAALADPELQNAVNSLLDTYALAAA